MDTPICDFVEKYINSGAARLHMPGHKGVGQGGFGCVPFDITEIAGADSLYDAAGIIAESEANAGKVFGSDATYYSAEGSSQVIKAMLYLVSAGVTNPVVLAARNVHKAFVQGCALCDINVEWLYPDAADSICSCPISAAQLREKLTTMAKPVAVYITSPDYLGNMADVGALAAVCRDFDVPLLVDNAHGAYLKFLLESLHPLDLGADMCCDSAHKTLPVLTGGAYLHIAEKAWDKFAGSAKQALGLFGSTSPSYLILQSLDRCNQYLANGYKERLVACIARVADLKRQLASAGYDVLDSDPLKLTLHNLDGVQAAAVLRQGGVECEYADKNYLVLMFTPENRERDYERMAEILLRAQIPIAPVKALHLPPTVQAVSVRCAMFSPWQVVPVSQAVGRVCSVPLVSCPPAVPIVMSGEVITADMLPIFDYYDILQVAVLKE